MSVSVHVPARHIVAAISAFVLCLALIPAPATAQQDPDLDTATGQSEPIYEEQITEVYEVQTDHGTMYGEVIRPVVPEGTQVPVIFTYSPYNIIGQSLNPTGSIADGSLTDFYVPRGYARAVFDVVGTRNSGGCYDYGGIAERETGRDVIDFLGSQDWSNGKVGMIGGSYDGTTQWAAAIEHPEHLTTIVPQVAIDRWYDYAFGGGIRYFLNNENPTDEGFDTPLAFDFGFGFLPPSDPARQSPGLAVESVEGSINPCERVTNTMRAYQFDPVYDEFWEERDYRRQADQITASVMIEAGWLDHNVKHWDSTRMFMALPQDHPKRLVMGQWNHTNSRFEDAEDVRHAWFDYWLLGLDTGVMDLPAVDSQMGGTDERVQSATWPPPGTQRAVLELTGAVEGDVPLGTLALVGTDEAVWTSGEPPATEEELLADTSSARGNYLHFQSAPLTEDVRVSGNPLADLTVTSTGESTHFTPVLYEQEPDGTINVVTRGFLNGRNRNGLDVSEPVPTNEPYHAPVDMWDTDYKVVAGNVLGLVMASDNTDWALTDDDANSTNILTIDGTSVVDVPVSEGAAALGSVQTPAPEPSIDPTEPSEALTVERVAGPGRVETAAEVSRTAFDQASTVVIATAENYPDALAGAPLAVDLDAPLLLTDPRQLSTATAEEVQRLGATEAVLLGGEAALSTQVAADLAALDVMVRRVEGPDRFATAASIAAELPANEIAFVVEGANDDPARGWPDAVSAAPVAAFSGAPVLLVMADTLPEATSRALDDRGVTETIVVGGPGAVNEEVLAQIEDAGHGPRRVSGEDRYATSAAVHAEALAAGMTPTTTWLATGLDWPDALTGGAAIGAAGDVLLLVDSNDLDASPATRDVLTDNLPDVIRLLGGPAAISDSVRDQLLSLG